MRKVLVKKSCESESLRRLVIYYDYDLDPMEFKGFYGTYEK